MDISDINLANPKVLGDDSDTEGVLMTRIYLAGPLFCKSERDYNLVLKKALKEQGYEVLLPQDNDFRINAGRMLTDQDYRDAATMMVFQADLEMLDSCDAVVLNMDGRVTVTDMAEYLDVVDKTVYYRLKKMGDEFTLENGVITRSRS